MNFSVDILTNVIINTYFLSTRCIIIFTDSKSSFDHDSPIPVVEINVEKEDVRPEIFFNRFGCQGIVINHREPLGVFQRIEWEIRHSLERFNSRKFLISSGVEGAKNAMNIFDSKELNFVADLVVMELLEDSCKLWTHKYVGVDGNTQKWLLDVWFPRNRSFLFGADLYPNKLVNQMGRLVKFATFQYEPSSIVEDNKLKGSELSTMREFAIHFNMTPTLVISSVDRWGSLYENWTGTGMLGNLLYDKADFGFNGLYGWYEHYHYFDLSRTFIRSGVTCLCPAPRLADGWLTPIYSFSTLMWCFVASAFFSLVCAHFFLFYAKTNESHSSLRKLSAKTQLRNSIHAIFKLFVFQIVKKAEIPPGAVGTLFMGMLFVFGLFITAFYDSGLATVLTIPTYENAVDTVDEIVESGMLWLGQHRVWVNSLEQADHPKYKALVKLFVAVPSDEELIEFSKTSKYAFVIEGFPKDNYAIEAYITRDVIENYVLMKDEVYWEEFVIMGRKSSILLPQLNQFLSRTYEAGLISYWQSEATLLYMDSYIQNSVNPHVQTNREYTVKLKWTHVAGTFTILGLGYIITTIVFLLELLINRLSKRSSAQFIPNNHRLVPVKVSELS